MTRPDASNYPIITCFDWNLRNDYVVVPAQGCYLATIRPLRR